MGNWLQKTPSKKTIQKKQAGAPALAQAKKPLPPAKRQAAPRKARPQSLPIASIIYGIGASLVFLDSFYMLLSWKLFSGALTFFIGGCLSGFALYHIKHPDA